MTSPPQLTDLISATKAAEILGHTRHTVKRMAARGALPYELQLANGTYLFSLAKIKAIAIERAEEARQRAEAATA